MRASLRFHFSGYRAGRISSVSSGSLSPFSPPRSAGIGAGFARPYVVLGHGLFDWPGRFIAHGRATDLRDIPLRAHRAFFPAVLRASDRRALPVAFAADSLGACLGTAVIFFVPVLFGIRALVA